MAYVRLLFPCWVTVSPISKSTTRWNSAAREPVLQVARAADDVQVRAQVEFITRRNPDTSPKTGVSEKTSGYLVVLVDEIATIPYAPKRGDKITAIPGEDGVFYVTYVTPHAHKGGRNRTLHLGFEDRQPVGGG